MNKLTQSYLMEIISYDKESGTFTWLERDESKFHDRRAFLTWNKKYQGRAAGSIDNRGYMRVTIDNKNHKLHRLAWLYVHGELPEVIDHINGVKTDNRINNLRSVSILENCKNTAVRKVSKTGITGVEKRSDRKKYIASITVNGKRVHLGSFSTAEEAGIARKKADIQYGFHANHGSTRG